MSTDKFSREQQLQKLFYEFRENSALTVMVHQAIATKLGLNVTDHKCLDIIVKNEPMTAGQLSELTGLSTGAVTGVLDRLEKSGYIFREKDSLDKRKVIIKVNQNKLKEKLPVFDRLTIESREMLSIYSDEELQFIYEYYKRCNHALLNVLQRE